MYEYGRLKVSDAAERSLLTVICFVCLVVVTTSATNPRWPTSCKSIGAAFTLPYSGSTFLVSRRQFVEYSFELKSEKRTGRIDDLGITQRRIQAAFSGMNDDIIVFKGCSFYRYNALHNLPLQFVESKNVSEIGLPCNVNAAIRRGNQTLAFKGCKMWKLNASGYFEPFGLMTSRQLPCNIDSAIEWTGGIGLFIKGHQYWTFDHQTRGPFHTDTLNICSWYLCGEADWMTERPPRDARLACNGDPRLCPLRLNQVTLAGLHNAGAGFYGGFGLLNCWMRNHGLNITRQLEIGIRHLDIDPCYETCGLLGTCHAFACGGSICMMIKQIRYFLHSHRNEVITLNFNHEIVDADNVFRDLTKQLKVQLQPMLNTYFRLTGGRTWPTLYNSIVTNRRVFVFYAPIITEARHRRRYVQNLWIHSERTIGSTWRPFTAYSGCQEVVNLTAARCNVRQRRELVEVSTSPETGGCISGMASSCRQYLHQVLKVCQPFRFRHGKSPNILLVDYPEIGRTKVMSVFNAVHHQNVRNVAQHRYRACRVSIDAAVTIPHEETSLFFVGTQIVVYDHRKGFQTNIRPAPDHLKHIDAAFESTQLNYFHVIKDCHHTTVNAISLQAVTSSTQNSTICSPNIQAAVRYQNAIYTFQDIQGRNFDSNEDVKAAVYLMWKNNRRFCRRDETVSQPLKDLYIPGCQIKHSAMGSGSSTTVSTTAWGLPCHVDAAVRSRDGQWVYIFKGNNVWQYGGHGVASYKGRTLDWNIDVVTCTGS